MRKRPTRTPDPSNAQFFNFSTIIDDGRHILLRAYTQENQAFGTLRCLHLDTRDHLTEGSYRDDEEGYPETHADIIGRARQLIHPWQDNVPSRQTL